MRVIHFPRRRQLAPRERLLTRTRSVGTCGACQGPVMYHPAWEEAACPCGLTVLPRLFAEVGLLDAETRARYRRR